VISGIRLFLSPVWAKHFSTAAHVEFPRKRPQSRFVRYLASFAVESNGRGAARSPVAESLSAFAINGRIAPPFSDFDQPIAKTLWKYPACMLSKDNNAVRTLNPDNKGILI
jgi:hypothetical protein